MINLSTKHFKQNFAGALSSVTGTFALEVAFETVIYRL